MSYISYIAFVLLQLQSDDDQLQKKEEELQSCKDTLSEYSKQVENLELAVSEKAKTISYLENVIEMKDSEGKQTGDLIEKIKRISSENCQELQLQIDSVSNGKCFILQSPSVLFCLLQAANIDPNPDLYI